MKLAVSALLIAGVAGLLSAQSVSAETFRTYTYSRTVSSPVMFAPSTITRTVEQPVVIERVFDAPVMLEEKCVSSPVVIEKPVMIERPVTIERTFSAPVNIERTIERPIIIENRRGHHLLDLRLF